MVAMNVWKIRLPKSAKMPLIPGSVSSLEKVLPKKVNTENVIKAIFLNLMVKRYYYLRGDIM